MIPLLFALGGPADGLDAALDAIAKAAPEGSFFSAATDLRALVALVLVSLTCGAIGPLVVGGRLAFFSDAMAHCAFASVSVGFILFTFGLAGVRPVEEFWDWVTPVMIGFALLVGYAIAVTRERTGLSSDTVIGIFFAFAIGLAAMLRKLMSNRRLFSLEDVLFGDPLLVRSQDVVYLGVLLVVTWVGLSLMFNSLFLAGFNTSLALSRRVRLGLVQRLFILLLAVVVTLCVRTVGVLLINALLVVPAATAANLSRNLRQMFWLSVCFCLASALLGQFIVWETYVYRKDISLGTPGVIILVSVALFVGSALVGPWLQRRARVDSRQ